mgnify:CR=1 FL=1
MPATGPAPAAGGAAGLVPIDRAVGQRLLQFGEARLGDLRSGEIKRLQVGQPQQVHQSSVGELRNAEGGGFLHWPYYGRTSHPPQPANDVEEKHGQGKSAFQCFASNEH